MFFANSKSFYVATAGVGLGAFAFCVGLNAEVVGAVVVAFDPEALPLVAGGVVVAGGLKLSVGWVVPVGAVVPVGLNLMVVCWVPVVG